jgi:alanyl-tRNA synthetase
MNNNNLYNIIKNKFFNFFASKGYKGLKSCSLLMDDPELLFTVAGMVQFKDIFLRQVPKTYDRVVTIQKCLRVGGKHNDLENVGFTKRHNTFFEMIHGEL